MNEGRLKIVVFGALLLSHVTFLALTMFGAHSEIGVIGFLFFFPAFQALSLLPTSLVEGGIDFRLEVFVVQLLIFGVIAQILLVLRRRRMATKRGDKRSAKVQ